MQAQVIQTQDHLSGRNSLCRHRSSSPAFSIPSTWLRLMAPGRFLSRSQAGQKELTDSPGLPRTAGGLRTWHFPC